MGGELPLGVLVVPVMTVREGDRPLILILSSQTLEEIARIEIPHRLPPGFHAHFQVRN